METYTKCCACEPSHAPKLNGVFWWDKPTLVHDEQTHYWRNPKAELWSVEQAAKHWGVSQSRARSILSERGIQRVTGYQADEIKAVVLRQGARNDLTDR